MAHSPVGRGARATRSLNGFDVVVVGGGPAGLCTALGLRKHGHSVCVVERGDYTSQPVGEHLSARGVQLLHELGLESCLAQLGSLPSPGMISVWGSAEPTEMPAFFRTEGAGLHLPRPAFERALGAALIDAGGVLLNSAKLLSVERPAEQFVLHLRHASEQTELATRFVVDATGRSAALARRQGYSLVRRDRMIGLSAYVQRRERCVPMVEASPRGWWYSASLPDEQLLAIYFTDADLRVPGALQHTWQLGLSEAPQTRQRLGADALHAEPRGVCAHTQSLAGEGVPEVIAVGDAALGLDPLSSAGLSQGISSAHAAAQAISEALAGNALGLSRYRSANTQSLRTHLAQRAHYYGRETRFESEPFWQRRHRASDASTSTEHQARVLPNTVLRTQHSTRVGDTSVMAASLAALTPDIDVATLTRITAQPLPARRIAEELRTRYHYHDAELVHLLHVLVARGALVVDSAQRTLERQSCAEGAFSTAQ